MDGTPLEVKFWDTAGQSCFTTLTYSFYAKADGIIVAFDITSETSFNNCNMWIQSILKHKGTGVCKILIGNKADLIELQDKCVQDDQAQKLSSVNDMQYFKTSALKGEGVEEALTNIIR